MSTNYYSTYIDVDVTAISEFMRQIGAIMGTHRAAVVKLVFVFAFVFAFVFVSG